MSERMKMNWCDLFLILSEAQNRLLTESYDEEWCGTKSFPYFRTITQIGHKIEKHNFRDLHNKENKKEWKHRA